MHQSSEEMVTMSLDIGNRNRHKHHGGGATSTHAGGGGKAKGGGGGTRHLSSFGSADAIRGGGAGGKYREQRVPVTATVAAVVHDVGGGSGSGKGSGGGGSSSVGSQSDQHREKREVVTGPVVCERQLTGEFMIRDVLALRDDVNFYVHTSATYSSNSGSDGGGGRGKTTQLLTRWQIKVRAKCADTVASDAAAADGSSATAAAAVGVFISLADNDGEVPARYTFSIRDTVGELSNQCHDHHTFPRHNHLGRGWTDFVTHAALQDPRNGYLHGGGAHLVLHYQIDVEVEGEGDEELPLPADTLPADIKRMMQRGTASDLNILVDGASFPAHRALLAERSPVLRDLLTGDANPGGSERVTDLVLEGGATVQSAQYLVEYLYTGTCPAELAAHADKVLPLAHRYGLPRLAAMCANLLLQHRMQPHTVIPLLHLATHYTVPGFKDKVFDYVSRNSYNITDMEDWKLLASEHPDIVSELVRWQSKMLFEIAGVKSSSV